MTGAVIVHYTVEGPPDAPALLLLNSLGTTLEMWDPQVTALAERFRVIRFDQRGHGASPVPPGPYGIGDLGTDALALLDRLGIERAHLCGLSLGGMVAMWLATRAPARVRRLVLCCTAAWFRPAERWLERAATVRADGMSAVVDTVLRIWFTDELLASGSDALERARAMLVSAPPDGYAASCEMVASTDLRGDLAEIGAPTLVVAGAEDPAAPADRAEELVLRIPDARLEVVDKAAHLANLERPDEVTELILRHLLPTGTTVATEEES